jgi:hypothetical protein
MKIVPVEPTIAELEKKAADCEEKAAHEIEPAVGKLHELANLYRGWIAALRSRKWTS